MKKELIDLVSKKIQLMSVGGIIVTGVTVTCAAAVSITLLMTDTIKTLSDSCDDFGGSTNGPSLSINGKNCKGSVTQSRVQDPLPKLYIPTELEIENLFSPGDYNLSEKQKNELKKKDKTFQLLAKQKQILYIQGSADETGDGEFVGKISTDRCANQVDFSQIKLHLSLKENYEKQLSSKTIPPRFINKDLPQLRARSFQCLLKSKYPTILTEIIEGGVQTGTASQYRRVVVFTDIKSITSQITLKPSPD